MASRAKHGRWLTIVGVSIGALLLWLALREADFAGVIAAFRDVRVWTVAVFAATTLAYYVLKAVRWSALLSPLGTITGRALFAPVMIGYTAGILLPMQLGEVVKAWLAARRFNLPGASVLSSIAIERLFDVAALLLIVVVTVFAGTRLPDEIVTASFYIGAAAAVGMALTLVFIVYTPAVLRFIDSMTYSLPLDVRNAIRHHAAAAAQGMHSLHHPGLIIRIAINSILQWALMATAMYVSLIAVGIEVPPAAAVVVLVFTVISLTLPSSPGNIGSIQAAYYLALKPFGVSATLAFSASVYFHILSYSVVAAGGLYCLHQSGYRLQEVIDASRPGQATQQAPDDARGETRD